MNAIKSITPILLTKKIEPPSFTQEKGVFLIQKKIAQSYKVVRSQTWEPKYPNTREETSAFIFHS